MLVTNGENIKTLSVMKAISKHDDFEVHITSHHKYAACFFSKYCKGKILTADPAKNKELFVKDLLDYIAKNKINIFIPVNPPELSLILENKKEFDKITLVPFTDSKSYETAKDKWEFYNILKKAGVLGPTTYLASHVGSCEYPLVIKERKGAGSENLVIAKNKQKLDNFLNSHKDNLDDYIAQEFVDGENYGAGAFCRNGKIESVFTYKSLREFHVTYGTSTSRISIHDSSIEKDTLKILKHMKWHGIAHFDLIKSNEKNYFLEMNPRLWMSVSLPIFSGLDYPYYLCKIKENIDIPKDYKDGVIARIIFSDLLVYLKCIFSKKKYPISEFLKKSYLDDVDFNDLLPSVPLFIRALKGREI